MSRKLTREHRHRIAVAAETDRHAAIISERKTRSLLGSVAEHPDGLAFEYHNVAFLSFHKAVFPRAATREGELIVPIETHVALTVARRPVDFQRGIGRDRTQRIPRATLVTPTGHRRCYTYEDVRCGESDGCASLTHAQPEGEKANPHDCFDGSPHILPLMDQMSRCEFNPET